ncbi:MAG: DNA repair protein RecN [Chthoniobacterales bacterium]
MLRLLKIRNLALVEELSWELPSGFVSITGETGAGKSVIVGALKFLIGERADRGLVRRGADSATIEAVFQFEKSEELNSFLEGRGVDSCHEGELVLRRSIALEGTGRQFVNGSPCNLALLRDLGERLVDLHGPHDHQSLFSRSHQTFLLDSFSSALTQRNHYFVCRKNLAALIKEEEAMLAESGGVSLLEQLHLEVDEISSAQINLLEEEELLARHRAAAHGKKLLELSALAMGRLSDDDLSTASTLAEAARLVRELARLDPRAEEQLSIMDEISEKLQELIRGLSNYSEKIELDQGELQKIEERLDLLGMLQRKYGPTLQDVIDHGTEARERLNLISTMEERRMQLQEKIKKVSEELLDAAKELSAFRKKGAAKLTTAIVAALGDLGFLQAVFEIALEKLPEGGSDGPEQADFLFAPNPGESKQPLRKIASSGEISRVMLALKSVMAFQDRIPLLVFDEIDANVGGEIASKVGAKMKELGCHHQVLCITHLPQVAAAAASQFVVQKEVESGRTSTRLMVVEGKIREHEIARMLGGTSASALAHAEALLRTTNAS